MTSLDPFISRDDLSSYLGRDVTEDEGALIAIDAGCDMVRTLTAQDFNHGTSSITLDGTGGDALVLPQFPAITAGTVTVNGGTITDYRLSEDGVLLRLGGTITETTPWPYGVWPKGRQNVAVTYEHGYEDALLPRDVRLLALSIAARVIVQGVAKDESIGQARITYGVSSTDLTSGEKMIIQKYRRSR